MNFISRREWSSNEMCAIALSLLLYKYLLLIKCANKPKRKKKTNEKQKKNWEARGVHFIYNVHTRSSNTRNSFFIFWRTNYNNHTVFVRLIACRVCRSLLLSTSPHTLHACVYLDLSLFSNFATRDEKKRFFFSFYFSCCTESHSISLNLNDMAHITSIVSIKWHGRKFNRDAMLLLMTRPAK